jgi:hypothetical protein
MPKILIGNIKGPAGIADTDIFVKAAAIDTSNHLILTKGDGTTVDVGSFTGAYVKSLSVDGSNHLIVTHGDTSTVDVGPINPIDDLVDPGLTLAAATNFSVTNFQAYIVGRLACVDIDLTYSGSTLTATSTGNITPDVICATLPVGLKPASEEVHLYDKGGTSSGGAFIETNGEITIKTLSPTATIASGDVLHLGFTYLLA